MVGCERRHLAVTLIMIFPLQGITHWGRSCGRLGRPAKVDDNRAHVLLVFRDVVANLDMVVHEHRNVGRDLRLVHDALQDVDSIGVVEEEYGLQRAEDSAGEECAEEIEGGEARVGYSVVLDGCP